jgi:hypothetical protein
MPLLPEIDSIVFSVFEVVKSSYVWSLYILIYNNCHLVNPRVSVKLKVGWRLARVVRRRQG